MSRVLWIGGALVLAVVLAEGLAFWALADVVGWGWAVLVVLASTPLGAWLVRREGLSGWRRVRAELAAGGAVGDVLAGGAVGLLGAILVLLPGLVSDVCGLVLVGPARGWVASAVASRWVGSGGFGPRRVRARRGDGEGRGGDAPVVEGEIVD